MAVLDRTKADYWRRMIRRQAGSGMSVRAWCGRQCVSEASFFWWRRRLTRSGMGMPTSRPRRASEAQFVSVRVATDPAGAANDRPACIEILLRGERRVRVFGDVDRRALADVLAVLRSGDGDAACGVPQGVNAEAAAC